ncbi:NERD domain-containing protein [Alkalicoccobacillus porphyridii]|nr:NERD domain-containing protein [Alkalicoccobacillus porphyridii]
MNRSMPIRLHQLKALKNRLPSGWSSKMKEDLTLYEAGYRGERNLEYHLNFLEDRDFVFVHDLRLRASNGHYFQVDTLVVTSRFFVIVEVKNLVGRIEFHDELKQMVRRSNGEDILMPNPLHQVRRQQAQLSDWLLERDLPLMPCEQLIVFANPSTIIHSTEAGKKSLSKVVYAEGVVPRLEKLKSHFSKGRSYFDKSSLAKLVDTLKANHAPSLFPILSTYQLNYSNLQKGVFCPDCRAPRMNRQGRSGSWHCKSCGCKSKDAHIRALEDYYLLVKPTITNAEVREFLGVESKDVAKRFLSKLDIKSTHKNRYCYYHLTFPLRLKKI